MPSTVRMQPIAVIAGLAISKGLPLDRLEAATGLKMTDLLAADRRVPQATVAALWACIAEALPDAAIGLEMAAMAPFEFFGPLLHVASHAETLRDGLHAFVRYRRLLASDLHMALDEGPLRTALVMHHPLGELGPSPGPEVALGVGSRFIAEVLGAPGVVVGVDFAQPPMAPIERYRALFAAPVRFEQPMHRLWVDSAALDRPTGSGDAHRFERLTAHLDLLHQDLVGPGQPDDLTAIRAGIAHNARRGEYGAPALARHLRMSLRSLQRRVGAAGTTLRRLIDDARERHARRLLGDPSLSTDEVAFLLGYSSESAFRRAFHRWTGTSPAAVRRASQGGPPAP